MNTKTDVLSNADLKEFPDIGDFVSMCDTLSNLMISIFHVDKQKFIYHSHSSGDILGYSPDTLIRGGWDLWYSFLKPSERPVIQHELSEFISIENSAAKSRRTTLEYHIQNSKKEWVYIRHEISLRKRAGEIMALSYMYDHSEKKLIDNYLTGPPERFNAVSISRQEISITDRERQVLKLIGCGLSSKQIAKELFISNHTAISHRKNLIEKFGVKNTAELVKEASKIISL